MSQGSKQPSLLGMKVSTGSFQEFVENIASLKETQGSGYTCCANVHMVIESYKDPDFRRVVNQADFATPDGSPLRHCIKLLYGLEQPRVSGPDLMPALLELAEKQGKRVYFLGDTEDVLRELTGKVRQNHPGIEIAGYFSPPFRDLNESEKRDIIDMVNATSPDLLFVALGCPKQEKWMAAHKGKIFASMIGVGYAFRTYAGLAERAPEWMQSLSLEWLFRLFQNPKRLWKRYLVTNSLFVWLIFKSWIHKLFSSDKKIVSAS